jgi:SAM-dependent methyltransferase
MTKEWYSEYYRVEYRRQMERFKRFRGQPKPSPTIPQLFESQLRHAQRLTQYLNRYLQKPPAAVLEIGCSSGGVLAGLRNAYGCDVVGVEPGPDEAEYARSQGILVHDGVFEDVAGDIEGGFDLILCTQTFNHLLDPLSVSRSARSLLKSDGLLLVECQNFLRVCAFRGRLEDAIQIDHTYMFTPPTMIALLRRAGFEVLDDSVEYSAWRPNGEKRGLAEPDDMHMRVLARPGNPALEIVNHRDFIVTELAQFSRLRPSRLLLDLGKIAIRS